MAFSITTKTEMFIRCGRLCCLCLKQCGTNMEAAHIIDESHGGSNDASNGIPVCFDCHQEMGAYDDKHPRGNKVRPEELTARRDRVYQLVETGVIYAQIIAERQRLSAHAGEKPAIGHIHEPPKASPEARRFLRALLSADSPVDAPARKLSLLNEQDRAYVLDGLLQKGASDPRAVTIIGDILQSKRFKVAEPVVIAEQLVRAVTLYGDVAVKAELLRAFPQAILAAAYEGLRLAFFEDLIGIVKRDQFIEVNKIVPPLVEQVGAIPEELHQDYVLVLLDQARSESYNGAPAARRALSTLPEPVARAGIKAMHVEFLVWNGRYDHVKEFVQDYQHLASSDQKTLLTDFLALSQRAFFKKHVHEGQAD